MYHYPSWMHYRSFLINISQLLFIFYNLPAFQNYIYKSNDMLFVIFQAPKNYIHNDLNILLVHQSKQRYSGEIFEEKLKRFFFCQEN